MFSLGNVSLEKDWTTLSLALSVILFLIHSFLLFNFCSWVVKSFERILNRFWFNFIACVQLLLILVKDHGQSFGFIRLAVQSNLYRTQVVYFFFPIRIRFSYYNYNLRF